MRVVKIVAIVLLVYVGIVATFESLLGYYQPAGQSTLTIITHDADGSPHPRVLARLESAGQMYVAVNHWPRAWYHSALERPQVEITYDGVTAPYLAVPVTGVEHDQVNADNPTGIVFKLLTGFPPRYFVRLEPRVAG